MHNSCSAYLLDMQAERTSIGGKKVGGIGSGRRVRDKSKVTMKNYKPAKDKKESMELDGRLYSVPAHVSEIRMPGACRIKG